MKSYIINLDRSADRLAHMQAEFERVGLDYVRVAAVDGDTFSQDFLDAFARERPLHDRWWKGVAAAFLSHARVWEAIVAGNDGVAAVFEDDVHLAADIAPALRSPDWIPEDADIVRLEANGPMVLRRRQPIAECPGRSVYRVASAIWGAAGYVITRRAAGQLLEAPPRLHHAIDAFMFSPHLSPVAAHLNCYQIKPALCIQDMLLNGKESQLGSVTGNRFPSLERLQRKRSNWLRWLRGKHRQQVPFQP